MNPFDNLWRVRQWFTLGRENKRRLYMRELQALAAQRVYVSKRHNEIYRAMARLQKEHHE